MYQTQLTPQVQDCISKCLDCARVCKQTLSRCMQMGGTHTSPKHISLLNDCIEVCNTTAKLLQSNSMYHMDQCAVCQKVCEACAYDCERFQEQFMKDCAGVCLDCSKACEQMIGGPIRR